MTVGFGPADDARPSASASSFDEAPGVERGPRSSGIQGLLRIAELSANAVDADGFAAAVLESAVRTLRAEGALIVARGPAVPLLRRHAGSAAVARRLLSHVHGLVWTRTTEATAWCGDECGLAVLGALIPEAGQARLILCVARDPRGSAFRHREKELLLGYAQTASLVLERIRLQEALERQRAEITTAFVSALASRDGYLQGHSTRVALYAEEAARTMELPADEVAVSRRTGILHDLGKLSTPDRILLKPGPLTDDEYAHIRYHPAVAASLLEPYDFLAREAEAVKRHHERYDGRGYPDGLAGAAIPLTARIVSVADAWDAMTSDRPYRRACSFDFARQEIEQGAGRQFDPAVTQAWQSIPDSRLASISASRASGRESIFRVLASEAKTPVASA